MRIQWSQKHMARIKLNQFLSKHLLKIVATGDCTIELTRGAERQLQKRMNELLPTTLKLIVLSKSINLIGQVIDVLPRELLVELIGIPDIRRIISKLDDTRVLGLKDELLALIPSLKEDDSYFIDTIIRNFPAEAMAIGKDFEPIASRLVSQDNIKVEDMMTILNKFPSTLYNALSYRSHLTKMLQAGCFRLEPTGKEFKEE